MLDKAAHDVLAADHEELKTAKAQVAELKNELIVKDRLLSQGEQRQQELERNLEQAKTGQGCSVAVSDAGTVAVVSIVDAIHSPWTCPSLQRS